MTIRFAAAAAFLVTVACGSKSTPGGPPTGPTTANPPQLSCPADVTLAGVAAAAQSVTYTAPTVSAGQAPVNVTCSPASGASFPLGDTSVSCAASDAMQRQATCSFKVTLKGMALGVLKFGAYGDSLTEGETGRGSFAQPVLDTPNAYPTKVQLALEQSYPGQGAVVINRGHSGDPVEALDDSKDTTLNAIKRFLPGDRPNAVLLLSGFNNLLSACDPGSVGSAGCRAQISFVPIGLRDCVRKVRELNVGVQYIFLSTLTPPGPSGSHRIDRAAIEQTNESIRQLAATERVALVDAYVPFVGHEADYVTGDGLHLTPAGYQALADAFFAAIQKTVPQTPLFGVTGPR